MAKGTVAKNNAIKAEKTNQVKEAEPKTNEKASDVLQAAKNAAQDVKTAVKESASEVKAAVTEKSPQSLSLATADKDLQALAQAGELDKEKYMALADKYTGSDSKAVDKLKANAQYWHRMSSGEGKRPDDTGRSVLENAIAQGLFNDKEELLQELRKADFTPAEVKEYTGMFDRQQNKEGEFQYDWKKFYNNYSGVTEDGKFSVLFCRRRSVFIG